MFTIMRLVLLEFSYQTKKMLTVNVNVNVKGLAESRRQRKWPLPRGYIIRVTFTFRLTVNIFMKAFMKARKIPVPSPYYMSLNLSINVLVVLLTNAYFLHVDPVNISIVDLGDKIRKSDFLK